MYDFAQLHSSTPAEVYTPESVWELELKLQTNTRPITIAGAQYSHGGQTLYDGSLHLDLRKLNRIVRITATTVTVEAGTTWWELQQELDKHNLSVAEMQSYSNFSIGGSLSVNCHGRGMAYGTVGDTVVSLEVLTSQGKRYNCSPTQHRHLFSAVLGGYGGIAIIIQATLVVVPNVLMRRDLKTYPQTEQGFEEMLRDALAPDVLFFNCNVYPQGDPLLHSFLWCKTKQQAPPELPRLSPHQEYHLSTMVGEQLLRLSNKCKMIRSRLEPMTALARPLTWRNYEMSLDVNMHRPLVKFPTTAVLQEYFIPVAQAYRFLPRLLTTLSEYHVNCLNLSLRYVKRTERPLLNYAPEDMVSFVLYYSIFNGSAGYAEVAIWTQPLLDELISLGGKFYLPYLLVARPDQVHAMYDLETYRIIKATYDPAARLTSQFWARYMPAVAAPVVAEDTYVPRTLPEPETSTRAPGFALPL